MNFLTILHIKVYLLCYCFVIRYCLSGIEQTRLTSPYSSNINFIVIIITFFCEIEGVLSNKIDPVVGNEFPYIVSLQLQRGPSDPWEHECHGTLIHKKYILTYGVCGGKIKVSQWLGQGYRAKFNQDNIINSTATSREEIKEVHYSGDGTTGKMPDAALIQLKKPVADSKIVAIKLSKQSYQPGTKLLMASWGKGIPKADADLPEADLKLKKRVVNIKNYKDCKQPDNNRTLPSVSYFCGDAASCVNDHGAPLVIKGASPDKDLLVGYYGQGGSMGECWRSPHFYSNATFYLPWINWILKQNGDTLLS